MQVIKKFLLQSFKDLLLTDNGGLSLSKLSLIITTTVATDKFIAAESNDPLIWLIYLGVVGGHIGAVEMFRAWKGNKENV